MEVSITQLSKTYQRFCALDQITLNIPGGMFGLLGPNGAGKTTLMRVITTLLRPTSGQVRVGSYDVVRQPGQVRQLLGYLPQDFGFYRNLTAFEILDYIGTMKNLSADARRKHIPAVLEQVNLTREAGRKVGGFSGGMKQRLGIAQALLGNPPLIIVDEPTAGLDPEERIRFRNLLSGLSRERTVLLSTHIVADIEAVCSGVAVLNHGRLIFAGAPQALVSCAQGQVWEVEANQVETALLEARFPVLASRAVAGGMHLRLIAPAAPLPGAQQVAPGLEDGYMVAIQNRAAEVRHA